MKNLENLTIEELKILAGFQNEKEFAAFEKVVKEPTIEYNGDNIKILKKLAIIEIANRINDEKIRCTSDSVAYFMPYADKEVEYFLLLTLNGANKPIKLHEVTKGLVNKTMVHPREVFKKAIEDNTVNVIICHNHPSGSLEASEEDLAITKTLVKAGELLGIKVIDHIIITPGGLYRSII